MIVSLNIKINKFHDISELYVEVGRRYIRIQDYSVKHNKST